MSAMSEVESVEFQTALNDHGQRQKVWAYRKDVDGDTIEVVLRVPKPACFDRFLGMSAERTTDVNLHLRSLAAEGIVWCNHPAGVKGMFDEYPMLAADIGSNLLEIAKGDRPKVARRWQYSMTVESTPTKG